MEVGRAEPRLLRIQIAEQTPLQQRIVGEVDPRHDVRRQECDLFGLGEEIVRIAVQGQRTDDPDGHVLLGNQLGRIQHVVGLGLGERLIEHLDAQIPLRKGAGVDRFP